ncbi:MFS transporter [Actinomadura sp. SCN-SB]|uniref:MFS transporter n=1 Tax=Actinomadura sp. SCN-SB TaxID=3373092 RepID=UPI0037530DF4
MLERRADGGARTADDGATGDQPPGTGAVPSPSGKRSVRASVGAVFFANGAAFSTWAARVPAVRDGLGLSPGDLSVALTGLAVGAVVGLPLAGALVARFGSRRVLAGAVLYLGALPLVAMAPQLVYLTAMLALFAIGNSALDVVMNTQGALAERAFQRPLMGGFHAMFSLGGVTGAGIGGLAAHMGVDVHLHFLAATVVLLAVCLVAARLLPPDPPSGRSADRQIALPVRGLWAPGAIAFCALMAEGLMNDWGSVYLHDVAHVTHFTAAAGVAVFSAGMVTGRLAADRIRAQMRPDRFLRGCALVAASGAALAVTLPWAWTGLAGYILIGLGLAAIIPVTFSHTAGRFPDKPGASIAAVSTVGYVGFLVGPPVIGLAAESAGLRAVMAVFLALMVSLMCMTPAVRPAVPGDAPEKERVRTRGNGR